MSLTVDNRATADAVEALVRQLYATGQVRRELGKLAHAELGGQGFLALAQVHLHGPIRVSEVAQRLAVDLSVASRQVAALVDMGYVTRAQDGADRRAQVLTATDAGRQALADGHRRMVAAFGEVLTGWSVDDVATLTSLLERLTSDFEEQQQR